MMQIETDEIASRYPKHVNKVNIFFAKPQSKFLWEKLSGKYSTHISCDTKSTK